jgi:hypothetical protein
MQEGQNLRKSSIWVTLYNNLPNRFASGSLDTSRKGLYQEKKHSP